MQRFENRDSAGQHGLTLTKVLGIGNKVGSSMHQSVNGRSAILDQLPDSN